MNCEDILSNSRKYIDSLHSKLYGAIENNDYWTDIQEYPPLWDEDLIKEHVKGVVDQYFLSPPSQKLAHLNEKPNVKQTINSPYDSLNISIESPGENEIKAQWKSTKDDINVNNITKETKPTKLKSPISTRTVELRKKLNDSTRYSRKSQYIQAKLKEYEKEPIKSERTPRVASNFLRFTGKPSTIPVDFTKEHPDIILKDPILAETLFPCRYKKTCTTSQEVLSSHIDNDNKISKNIKKLDRLKLTKNKSKILKSLTSPPPPPPILIQSKDEKSTWHEVLLEKRNFSKDLPEGKQQLNEKIITLRENSFIPTTKNIDSNKIVIKNDKLMNDNNKKHKKLIKNDDCCYMHEKICLKRNEKINKIQQKSIDVISDKLGKVTQYTKDFNNDKYKKSLKVQKMPVFCIRGECKVQKVVEIEIKPNLNDLSDYGNSKENSNVQYFQFVHGDTLKQNNVDVDNKKVVELNGKNILDEYKNINNVNPKELQNLNFEITDNDKENHKEKDNKKSANRYFTAFSKYIQHQILSDHSGDQDSNNSIQTHFFKNLEESLSETEKDSKSLSSRILEQPEINEKSYIIYKSSASEICTKKSLEGFQKSTSSSDLKQPINSKDIVHNILNTALLNSNEMLVPSLPLPIPEKFVHNDDIYCKEISTQTDINEKTITKIINDEQKMENHEKFKITHTNKNTNDFVDEIFEKIRTDEPEGLKNFKTINSNRMVSSEYFSVNGKTIEMKKFKNDVVENNDCLLDCLINNNKNNNENIDVNQIKENVDVIGRIKSLSSNQLITTNDKSIQVLNENYIDTNLKIPFTELFDSNETKDKFIPISNFQDNYSNSSKTYNNEEHNRINKFYNNDIDNGDIISIDTGTNYSTDINNIHKYVKCHCRYHKNSLDILMPSTTNSNSTSIQNTYKNVKKLDKERSKISTNYLRKLHKSIQKDIFEKSPKFSKTINRIYKNHDNNRNSQDIITNSNYKNQPKKHSDPEVQRAVNKFLYSLNLPNNSKTIRNIEKPNSSNKKHYKIDKFRHDNINIEKLLMCNEITTSSTLTTSSNNGQNQYSYSNTTTTSSNINSSLDKLVKLYGQPSSVNMKKPTDSITFLKNNITKYRNNSDSSSCSFSIDNTFVIKDNPIQSDNKPQTNRKFLNLNEKSSSSISSMEGKSKDIKTNTIETLSSNDEEDILLSEIKLTNNDNIKKLKTNNENEMNLSDGEIKSLGEI